MDLLAAFGSSWKPVSITVNFFMFVQTGCGFVAPGDWKPHGNFRLCVELSQYKIQRR